MKPYYGTEVTKTERVFSVRIGDKYGEIGFRLTSRQATDLIRALISAGANP